MAKTPGTATTPAILSSGDLAREAGLSVDTIYHYEKKGLLPRSTRTAAGYRQFPPEALRRLWLVRTALGLGFSLDEIASVIRDRDAGRAPCRRVLSLAIGKLEALQREIEERMRYRDELAATVAAWTETLEKGPEGEPAHLLESMSPRDETRPRSGTNKLRRR